MKYWLYTWDYPDDDIDEWAIYTVEKMWYEYAEGTQMARVKEVIIDKWNALKVDETDSFFDDAITENPKRVLRFLFNREF